MQGKMCVFPFAAGTEPLRNSIQGSGKLLKAKPFKAGGEDETDIFSAVAGCPKDHALITVIVKSWRF